MHSRPDLAFGNDEHTHLPKGPTVSFLFTNKSVTIFFPLSAMKARNFFKPTMGFYFMTASGSQVAISGKMQSRIICNIINNTKGKDPFNIFPIDMSGAIP